MKSIALLLLALVSIIIIGVPAFFIQVIRHAYFNRVPLNRYFHKLALSIDYLGATLLFGTVSRTVSSLVYQKDYDWAVRLIDGIFYKGHCKEEYRHETKNNIYQDEYGV